MFLQVLTMHPGFANHEFVWEFLLVQNMNGKSFAEKCERKTEKRLEYHSNSNLLFKAHDLKMLEIFFSHAKEQMVALSVVDNKLCQVLLILGRKVQNYNSAYQILSDVFCRTDVVKEVKHGRRSQKMVELALQLPSYAYSDFYVSLLSIANTVDTVIETISKPQCLIQELKTRESELNNARQVSDKLAHDLSWPLGFFDGKRRSSSIKESRFEIFENQREIHRLSSTITRHHATLASEIGSLFEIHGTLLQQMIGKFTLAHIKSQRVSLERLQRIQKHMKCESRIVGK